MFMRKTREYTQRTCLKLKMNQFTADNNHKYY